MLMEFMIAAQSEPASLFFLTDSALIAQSLNFRKFIDDFLADWFCFLFIISHMYDSKECECGGGEEGSHHHAWGSEHGEEWDNVIFWFRLWLGGWLWFEGVGDELRGADWAAHLLDSTRLAELASEALKGKDDLLAVEAPVVHTCFFLFLLFLNEIIQLIYNSESFLECWEYSRA